MITNPTPKFKKHFFPGLSQIRSIRSAFGRNRIWKNWPDRPEPEPDFRSHTDPSHDGSLPYMDILIHADKSTSVYRKPEHTNLYVRYNSCAPSSSKDSVIRSLTRRAHILCPQQLKKELDTVYTTPPSKMGTPWQSQTHHGQCQTKTREP